MNTVSGSFVGRRRLLLVELVAKIVLAFAIGLATSIALAGAVLLLAHDARASEPAPMQPLEAQQGTLPLQSGSATLAASTLATGGMK